MKSRWQSLAAALAWPVGIGLLFLTIARTDLTTLDGALRQLGGALPIVLLPGAAWHLLRTIAWHRCFPADARPGFLRLCRVRLAAEAFSFVTVRGVAGEPLKVVLLDPGVAPAVATAAVALERIAYLVVTAAIVLVASVVSLIVLPLSAGWRYAFAVTAGTSA